MDVLSVTSNSFVNTVLSMHQSSTTEPLDPSASEHLMTFYKGSIQSCVESSFSQALNELVGADIPVMVSPHFTQAMETEVLRELSSVFSSTTTAPAGSQQSKKTAAEQTLAGAILTMKSFLTGQSTKVKRRIQTAEELKPHDNKHKPTRRRKTVSLWKRCFSRRHSMIHPVPLEDPVVTPTSRNSVQLMISSPSQPKHAADNRDTSEKAETKTKQGFSCFFSKLFKKSKDTFR